MLKARKARRKPCEACGKNAIYCSPECKWTSVASLSPAARRVQRANNRRILYGLTNGQYDAMLAAQDGRCAICRTDNPRGKGSWHVDHCHTSGKVRELLCHNCNLALGNFKDSPDNLRAAIAYLERHTEPIAVE